jgi:hypothetical protein
MADTISTTHITVRGPAFSYLQFPRANLGKALARVLVDFGYAFDLAYVQPYRGSQIHSQFVLEGSEKGRDPSW